MLTYAKTKSKAGSKAHGTCGLQSRDTLKSQDGGRSCMSKNSFFSTVNRNEPVTE